jgi:AmmeMemoRadiSam system protein B
MMKNLRKASLPPGWYPRSAGAVTDFLKPFAQAAKAVPGQAAPAIAAVSPHAGWYYSGAIAARALSALASGAPPDTVAVIGGHLPGGAPPLFALEDAAETPFGPMEIDAELRDSLMAALGGAEDRWADNTVEVLLPMVRYFFPESRLLWARFPADFSSFEAGKALAAAASSLGRRVSVLGSTDLTHYGPNYGFSPKGSGQAALDWVKNVNDRRFIDAVLSGDPKTVLDRAQAEKSACSAGAVLGAMGFAAAHAAKAGCKADGKPDGAVLLEYGASADKAEDGIIPDSFVGYGAFAF